MLCSNTIGKGLVGGFMNQYELKRLCENIDNVSYVNI